MLLLPNLSNTSLCICAHWSQCELRWQNQALNKDIPQQAGRRRWQLFQQQSCGIVMFFLVQRVCADDFVLSWMRNPWILNEVHAGHEFFTFWLCTEQMLADMEWSVFSNDVFLHRHGFWKTFYIMVVWACIATTKQLLCEKPGGHRIAVRSDKIKYLS